MKRTLSLIALLTTLILSICISVSAATVPFDDGFVSDNEITVVSYNQSKTIVKGGDSTSLEDMCWWLVNNKDSLNVHFVSFLGELTSTNSYTDEQPEAKAVIENEFKAYAEGTRPLKDEDIPYGFSLNAKDYYKGGSDRTSFQSTHLAVDDIMPEGVKYEYLDDSNYYAIMKSDDGTDYIYFQLEVHPRRTVLNWLNSVLDANPDKYAIICTTSFINESGELYTVWDWDKGSPTNDDIYAGTSLIKHYNLFWKENPTDGQIIWDKVINLHTNVLAVISSNIKTSGIVMTKKTNALGADVALIAANVGYGDEPSGKSTLLFTKISTKDKTVTCAYGIPFEGYMKETEKAIKLDNIGTLSEPLTNDSLPQIATQYNGANTAYIFGYEGNTFRPNANMTRAEACTIFARLILGKQTIPDGYVTRFTDVKAGDWFYNAVAYLDQTGYFFRNKNTTYKPNEPITRAEFVDLANSASSLVATIENVSFNDVPQDHFYYHSITAAASSGLVNGYEDSTFRPDNTITRAEVVTVINRLLGLKATDRTISTDRLENVFVDIGSHWAKLNILMASNSNVHGEYYYSATLDGVSETAKELSFKNKHFEIVLNKKNGNISKIINLYNGENINSLTYQFIYLMNDFGTKLLPTGMSIEGNRIKVDFKGGYGIYLIADVEDNYMSFEIDSELPKDIKSVTFANLNTNLKASDDPESFKLNGIAMSAWTNPVNKGYSTTASKSTIAHAYTIYASGVMGAKMGVVFSKHADHLKYLQELTDAIDTSVGLASKAGGAYAHDWEGNFGDYVIGRLVPETLDANIQLALDFGADQYDIHQGSTSFRQGDFHFYYTENGTAKEYYETAGKKFEAAGLKTGLHTYAYYINYDATTITADNYWQKQLETLETYTLRGKLSKFKVSIKTEEDATAFDRNFSFFHRNSPYVRIDNEIIRIGQGTTEGFIKCIRGQCGTLPADHADGSTIYHLGGYFNMFAPVLGSELFYHVADLTAKAYNDGGFDMIYLDAIDGLNNHLKKGEETWYYFQMFVQRIISQCNRTPIVETSSSAPQEWNIRGRMGAWDFPAHAIKRFISNHVSTNVGYMKNNMSTTLGWFNFIPDHNPAGNMKNTIEKTLFRDDLDYLGMNAIIHDMSIVIDPFSIESYNNNAYFRDNVKYYNELYSNLRKSHYFSADVKSKVEEIGGEWKVIKKGDGEYAFLQMYYDKKNLVYARDYTDNILNGNNPFDAQTPFIRIESRYSTLFENPTVLADFDEEATMTSKTLSKSCQFDMRESMALVVKVKGTGKDGDGLIFTVKGSASSGVSSGQTHHFVDLNFEGWREFILIDADNAEYDVSKYAFSGVDTAYASYNTYRNIPPYSNITSITATVNTDSAKNVQIGDVVAYTHTDAPVKNPTVTIGSEKITFNCTVKGGEYIEYYPETNTAILYHNAEQTTENVTVSGSVKVPSGAYTATYSAQAETDAPVRARLVLGFSGQEIGNN